MKYGKPLNKFWQKNWSHIHIFQVPFAKQKIFSVKLKVRIYLKISVEKTVKESLHNSKYVTKHKEVWKNIYNRCVPLQYTLIWVLIKKPTLLKGVGKPTLPKGVRKPTLHKGVRKPTLILANFAKGVRKPTCFCLMNKHTWTILLWKSLKGILWPTPRSI